MQTLSTLLLFVITVSVWIFKPVYSGAGNVWEYKGSHGPEHWKVDYPVCGGHQQSPIEVRSDELLLDEFLEDFNLTGLNKTSGVSMLLKNVGGHTVEVMLSGEHLYVSGGMLKGDYIVKQFHFHWGLKDERGSEHVVDGQHFPMEMHVVLYNDKYSNISSALDKEHGLAVLGFFFQIGEENKNLMPLMNHLSDITYKEASKPISTFPISSMLPNNVNSWIRYQGSLTTPPCFETVTWTLFTEKITIAEHQIEQFRHILRNHRGENNLTLVDDFRPLQHLNHRHVYTNDKNLIHNDGNQQVATQLINIMVFSIALAHLYAW